VAGYTGSSSAGSRLAASCPAVRRQIRFARLLPLPLGRRAAATHPSSDATGACFATERDGGFFGIVRVAWLRPSPECEGLLVGTTRLAVAEQGISHRGVDAAELRNSPVRAASAWAR
jgi:hypothetical protein